MRSDDGGLGAGPRRVGGGVEDGPDDRGVPAGGAVAGKLAADRRSEPAPPPAADHAQITGGSDPIQQHRHRGQPALGLQRLGGGLQRRRPGALEQVPDLLASGGGVGDQAGPTRAEVPQPGPGRFGALGQVAAQL
ncbi:MAG: hypothetical protein ACRDQD_19840, partial [Nocardioidaceae bacterium]